LNYRSQRQELISRQYRLQNAIDDKDYLFPDNLQQALELLQEAMAGEQSDEEFYGYLITLAPNEEARKIIAGIRDDELKHHRLFRRVYRDLSNQAPPLAVEEGFIRPKNYYDGIKRALLGETEAVKEYRKILFALQNRVHINILTEIITDELRHGILYGLLLNM